MPALKSNKVLFAASAGVALGIYAALGKLRPRKPLIDSPEAVACRVTDENEKVDNDYPEYDVVIIGGGTAGCVLAARLSEDPTVRVLLLEAGGSSRNLIYSKIPAGYTRLMHTSKDYDLWTEPQSNLGDQKKYWPRGKMLGGCSAINAMMFHAGAPTDYDEWAASGQDGAEAWSYKEFRKYFLKFENYAPDPRFPGVIPTNRGSGGPVRIGHYGYTAKASSKWIETCIALGIPHNPDVNTPEGTMGVTKVMTYIDETYKRVTTETAYLTPEVLKRPNLKVAIHASVTRILFDGKRAVGVEFARKSGGPRYRVRVNKEVVLAAGAIHSPHILMLSGIGPEKHLAENNIPLVHNLPGVGQRLQDHAVVNTCVQVLGAVIRWALNGSGPMASNAGEAAAFVRTDNKTLFPEDKYIMKDETSSSNAPDIEAILVPLGYTEHGHGPVSADSCVTMGAVLLRPQSWGSITLKSADPFEAPRIDPRYLDSANDLAGLVRGLKLLIKIAQTEPFASSMRKNDDPLLDHNLHELSDEDLEKEVPKRLETLYHPTSTCRMAPLEDDGVVDPYLKVYGLDNVRVADASIFPRIVAGHTTAPSIAVGEKASDIIKEALSQAK